MSGSVSLIWIKRSRDDQKSVEWFQNWCFAIQAPHIEISVEIMPRIVKCPTTITDWHNLPKKNLQSVDCKLGNSLRRQDPVAVSDFHANCCSWTQQKCQVSIGWFQICVKNWQHLPKRVLASNTNEELKYLPLRAMRCFLACIFWYHNIASPPAISKPPFLLKGLIKEIAVSAISSPNGLSKRLQLLREVLIPVTAISLSIQKVARL